MLENQFVCKQPGRQGRAFPKPMKNGGVILQSPFLQFLQQQATSAYAIFD